MSQGRVVLSDEDVEIFVDKLKASDTDRKVDQIQLFGLTVEETTEISSNAIDGLTLTIAPLLKSSSQLLVASILTSFLPFYIPLLPTTLPGHLHLALTQLLPSILDKLNDPKDRVHGASNTCVTLLGKKCHAAEQTLASSVKGKEKEGLVGFWERSVREVLGHKGWRGKVEVCKILLTLRRDETCRLALKPWLSPIVDLLEDGDGNVRDQARETLVALLTPGDTPPAARMEVKKLLQTRNVRKTIAEGIISRIFSSDGAANDPQGDEARSGAATPAPQAADEVDVVYVASGKDLENEFAQMNPHFEGKETEHNWMPREKSLVRIRGLLRGQAHSKHPESFLAGLKMGVVEGISKTLLSLRTTVAQQACAVVQELAENMGSAFDPFVENLMPVLAKMAGFTKRIIAEKSQKSVTAIITHTTVSPRIFVAHTSSGIEDKNIQTRQYATAHLKTFIEFHARRAKNAIESTPAVLETIESSIKKGLADVNPQVREAMRLAFWSFNNVWPARGRAIMDTLDGSAVKQLEKANTAGTNGSASEPPSAAKPTASRRPTASSAMAALVAEKRRAKAAELAAGRAAEGQRAVSSPAPSSPLVEPKARSSSTHFGQGGQPEFMAGSSIPTRQATSHGAGVVSPIAREILLPESPADFLSRARSSSAVRGLSRSPPPAHGSPVPLKTSMRQTNGTTGLRSPDSGSSASERTDLRTPRQLSQVALVSGQSIPSANDHEPISRTNPDVDPKLREQAEQAEAAAQQLLGDVVPPTIGEPTTPARRAGPRPIATPNTNGKSTKYILKTPVNKFLDGSSPSGRAAWEDSPKPEAMTPLLFAQLKERKHERTWWLKRQELMDKASPLKSQTTDLTKAIVRDVEGLANGSPSMRALQKLALFAEEHPLIGDAEDIEENERIWRQDKTFDRIFEGLMVFLDPMQPIDLLEQALVVLWEMVKSQWVLFEDRDGPLVDALFRLRASPNLIIHESVNSLMSLLCEVSEPVFFSAVLQSALRRYLTAHPAETPASTGVSSGMDARSSGYTFGLTSIGLCVLKMPVDVLRIEGPKLAPLISEALSQTETIPRRAANVLILAIQAVILDSQATMDMLDLTEYQKNLVVYLMEKNGLRGEEQGHGSVSGPDAEEERRDRVVGEMVEVLGTVSRK